MPNPANPQSLNKYSYCLNNPLKYVDPSGHIVKIGDQDISGYDPNDENTWGSLDEDQRKLANEWYNLKQVDQNSTKPLEDSDIVFTLKYDNTLANDSKARWNGENQSIGINPTFSGDINTGVLIFAHECTHARQYIKWIQAEAGSWDRIKYGDTTYCEWEAYKYEGDLDDRLGYHKYWWWPWEAHCFAQKLNLETDYSQYLAWRKRLFSWNGSPPLKDQSGYYQKQGWFLTEDDYKNK